MAQNDLVVPILANNSLLIFHYMWKLNVTRLGPAQYGCIRLPGPARCHGHPVQIEDFRHFAHFQIEDLDFAHYILNPAASVRICYIDSL